jgi:hypothetical protein
MRNALLMPRDTSTILLWSSPKSSSAYSRSLGLPFSQLTSLNCDAVKEEIEEEKKSIMNPFHEAMGEFTTKLEEAVRSSIRDQRDIPAHLARIQSDIHDEFMAAIVAMLREDTAEEERGPC